LYAASTLPIHGMGRGTLVHMSRIVAFATMVVVACGSSTPAQSPPEKGITVSRIVDVWVTKTEQLLIPTAEALPQAMYGFAPTGGEFTGVRTFAEQVKHLAAANYQLGSKMLGEEPPAGTHDETAPDSVRSKGQIIEYLKGSFACLHRAAAHLNEGNLETRIIVGRETETAVGLMIDALVHSSNHYGQMVEYLRMNGIVPPASRP
jgi:hypothetical protein